MYKFFLPVILILVVIWVILGMQQAEKKDADDLSKYLEEELNRIEAEYETEASLMMDMESLYKRLDSITYSTDYAGFVLKGTGGCYLMVPAGMTETNDLNDEADLQMKNGNREFYMVMDKYSSTDENGYHDLSYFFGNAVNRYRDIVSGVKVLDSSLTRINGYNAGLAKVYGDFDNGTKIIPIIYYLGVYKHDGYIYDITIWTTDEYLDRNSTEMQKMLNSVMIIPE